MLLRLGVAPALTWRTNDPARAQAVDAEFQGLRPDILARDDHTCQGCGYRAERYQEVHHLDGDHAHNVAENLVTLCHFCHQSQHLGFAMSHGGLLIIAPEWKQEAFSRVGRAFPWIDNRTQRGFIEFVQERNQIARQTLGAQYPRLADYLLLLRSEESGNYEQQREELFRAGFRLAFGPEYAPEGIAPRRAYWREQAEQRLAA